MTNLYALRTLRALSLVGGPITGTTITQADRNLVARRNEATFARILRNAIAEAK
jgi:hypothetical protein